MAHIHRTPDVADYKIQSNGRIGRMVLDAELAANSLIAAPVAQPAKPEVPIPSDVGLQQCGCTCAHLCVILMSLFPAVFVIVSVKLCVRGPKICIMPTT